MKIYKRTLVWLSCACIVVICVSFAVGRLSGGFGMIFRAISGLISGEYSPETAIMFNIRLPRIAGAFIVGGALCASGCAYQGMFRNPIVSPDILGVAHGAGFGASLALFLRFDYVAVQLMAFAGGLIAATLTSAISKKIRMDRKIALVLTGTMLGTLFFSLITLLKFFSSPSDTLQEITFWLMGSLTRVTPASLITCFIPMTVGFILILSMRHKLNLLTLDDEEAQSIGLDVKKSRMVVMAGATLLTASSVTLGGLIGFVGLILPHLARRLVGADFSKALPVSILLGGLFLLVMDDIARSLFAFELPIGVLCAVVGAPIFLWQLSRGYEGGE